MNIYERWVMTRRKLSDLKMRSHTRIIKKVLPENTNLKTFYRKKQLQATLSSYI